MIRVGLDKLVDARTGRVWSGGDAMAWAPTPGLVGLTFPRVLSTEGLRPIASVVERVVGPRRTNMSLVLDLSRVTPLGCDEAAHGLFQRLVLGPLLQHPLRVKHLAVVGGVGLAQCALLGAVFAAQPSFQWSSFPRLEAVFEGVDAPWLAEVVGTINSELTPLGLVSRVRSVIGERPGASMNEVAQRLSLAPRSLQRALERSATTFHDERLEVRLELAASRLTKTNEKVTSIAREVGYASLPHFLAVFRRRFDSSPGEFRARHVGGALR